MSSRTRRVLLIGIAAVLIGLGVFKLVGNNDNSSSTTTTASSTDAWAEGACSALVTWKGAVVAAATSLKSSPTKANAQQAADDAKSATKTLQSSLSSLGKPGTSAGAQAKDTVDSLTTQMQSGVSKIQSAADGMSGIKGSAAAVSTISSTLVTMKSQLQTAGKTLRQLPSGDLQTSIANAPSCNTLKGSAS